MISMKSTNKLDKFHSHFKNIICTAKAGLLTHSWPMTRFKQDSNIRCQVTLVSNNLIQILLLAIKLSNEDKSLTYTVCKYGRVSKALPNRFLNKFVVLILPLESENYCNQIKKYELPFFCSVKMRKCHCSMETTRRWWVLLPSGREKDKRKIA